MDALADLNPAQHSAATHPATAGPLLVVAGAGSGKTKTLAARLAWLVQQGADPQRILLLTFSRRAASEMAHRAGQTLARSMGLSATQAPPTLPWCGTFHSVAARLLRDESGQIGLAANFTVLDRADTQDLLGLVREELGLAERSQRFPMPATCLAIHSRCINTRQTLTDVLASHYPWCARNEHALLQLFAAFGERKLQQQSLDFDDLLLAWWHLMQSPPVAARLRQRFDHLLVDEVQDLNRLQADILQAMKPTGQGLTAVGDDAQSIYAFRGADVQIMLGFAQRFEPSARVLSLTQNYRSTPQILAASNAVIALAKQRHAKELWSQRPAAGLPQIHTVADEAAQARAVTDAVLSQREMGLQLKQQAVLFRTTSHSAMLELELLRRDVPFVKFGGLRFLEAAHIKDMLAVLRWASNPLAQLAALRCARLVPGMGPASVRKLLAHPTALHQFKPPAAAAASWPALLQLMQHLRSPGSKWPDELQAVHAWYLPHLERLYDDARARDADLQQLMHIAATHKTRERFLTELTLDPPNASSNEAGPPHRDEDYLVLSTIHSAKGQEWRAVHVLNVVDGCMPADLATGRAEEIEEERRLLYVAMTRARDSLSLWVPQRFYITQQRALGSQHVYALRSRFVPGEVLGLFEVGGQVDAPSADALQVATAATSPKACPETPAAGAFDLKEALRSQWAGKNLTPGLR